MNKGKEECIKMYFRSWLIQNNDCWDELFAEDIYYSECYGPYYQGLPTLKKWFHQWNQFGKVLAWEIESILIDGDEASVSWTFHTIYEGEEDRFDGVSLISFTKDGKIRSVREYQSVLPHVEILLK